MFKDFKKSTFLDSYKKRWKYQKAKAEYYKKKCEELEKPMTDLMLANKRDKVIQNLHEKAIRLQEENTKLERQNADLQYKVLDLVFKIDEFKEDREWEM